MMRRRDVLAGIGSALGVPAAWSAEAGIGPQEIVLGHTGVLSGPLGAPIRGLLAGANLAFKQVNASGGVNGRRIRLESLDDELVPDKALANYRVLLEQKKVFAFFGCVGSGTTAAAAGVLQDSGAPLVGGYAVADSARRKVAGSAYFTRAGTGREAQALLQHLTTLGIRRIAMAHLDNPGGKEAAALLEQAAGQAQAQVVGAVPVKGDGANAAEGGASLAKLAPQAVVMYLAGDLPARLMKAHWEADGNASFYGMSIVAGEVVTRALGADVRSGLVVSQVIPYPWSQVDPTAIQFRRLAEAEGVNVGYVPYEGYISAQLMIEALRACGPEPTRSRLHTVLRTQKQRIAGIDFDFSDRSAISGTRFVEMVHVGREGRFTR